MKAIFKTVAEKGADIRETDEPVPDDHQVLIKVLRAGICGTYLHIFFFGMIGPTPGCTIIFL